MSKFVPNPNFEGALERQVQGAMRLLEDRIAEVARTHAGRPQPEVQAALEAAISGVGVEPNTATVAQMAKQISDEKPEG